MSGNVCPQCGKAVMTYSRFFREAEPYRISKCGSCGAPLKRSRKVFILLLVMCLILVVPILCIVNTIEQGLPTWIGVIIGIVVLAFWVLLTNYLGYRLIGWIPAENE